MIAAVKENTTLVLDNPQFAVLLIGSLVPLVGYVLNTYAPWVDEKVKGVVQVVVAAVAGGLYTALETKVFGFNSETAQLVFSAVLAALSAHHLLWKPANISSALGGGQNKNGVNTPT